MGPTGLEPDPLWTSRPPAGAGRSVPLSYGPIGAREQGSNLHPHVARHACVGLSASTVSVAFPTLRLTLFTPPLA